MKTPNSIIERFARDMERNDYISDVTLLARLIQIGTPEASAFCDIPAWLSGLVGRAEQCWAGGTVVGVGTVARGGTVAELGRA